MASPGRPALAMRGSLRPWSTGRGVSAECVNIDCNLYYIAISIVLARSHLHVQTFRPKKKWDKGTMKYDLHKKAKVCAQI